MISEGEKERIKALRDVLHQMSEVLGEENGPLFAGINMATLDALFAIREGEPWRGISDPKEIARTILHESSIGD